MFGSYYLERLPPPAASVYEKTHCDLIRYIAVMPLPTLPRKIEPPESFSPTDAFGADYQKLLIEQYKVYVDTTNKVSDRRGSAHTLLLTVNTSLITVYGLVLAKDTPLAAAHGPWTWLLPIVGLLVSFTWFLLIRSYRALKSAKFKVVGEIERRLPAQLFDLEWQYLERGETMRYTPLTHVEQYVPVAFGLFYVALLGVSLHLF